jgi:hypothetical protein
VSASAQRPRRLAGLAALGLGVADAVQAQLLRPGAGSGGRGEWTERSISAIDAAWLRPIRALCSLTSWTTVGSGTVIGWRNLIRLNPPRMAGKAALVIEQARGVPAIAELGLY